MAVDSDRWSALGWAIAIHLLLFGLITFGLSSHKPVGVSAPPIIQATAVSEEQVMEPVRRQQAEEAARKKRIADEKRRVAEQKRQAELKKKQAAEKARLAALEKKRKMEAARKAEEERKKAEEAKRKADEEKKRAEAEEAKKRQQAEEQLKAQMAAEAERLAAEAKRLDSARLSRLQDQYVADITNKVQRNWLRPPDSRGSFCSVVINQIPGGEIVGIRVTDCDGDVAFQRSVEAAVQKSSPLPLPKEPELFQREIEFVFKPVR